jgi:hypothetical protein
MTPKLERLDKWLLWAVCLTIVSVININFVTSYQHIYDLGLKYGEYGVDARLMPVGIDGMLLALSLANVFAAKFNRNHWLLRAALAFGVLGTVAANGAYGAHWGLTGNLLGTWSPVALFITVESGLFVFRIVAEIQTIQTKIAEAAKAAETEATAKRGRPAGSKNKPKTDTETTTETPVTGTPQLALPPVIKGHVTSFQPSQTRLTAVLSDC